MNINKRDDNLVGISLNGTHKHILQICTHQWEEMSQGIGHYSIFEITIDIVRRISRGTRTNHCLASGAITHTVGRSHFHILERCVKHSQKHRYKKIRYTF